MVSGDAAAVAEVNPRDAWDVLSEDAGSALIDVRSAAEWGFVGGPDLSSLGRTAHRIEWQVWPGMQRNAAFVDEVTAAAGAAPSALLFLCRSGVRSLAAARAVSDAYGEGVPCLNVAEGFEGDLDAEGHRGTVNGWKVRGLPWRQT